MAIEGKIIQTREHYRVKDVNKSQNSILDFFFLIFISAGNMEFGLI